jgi:hypothetical protein
VRAREELACHTTDLAEKLHLREDGASGSPHPAEQSVRTAALVLGVLLRA